MSILWVSSMFLGSLCMAQTNIFSQAAAGGSPFSRIGSASEVSAKSRSPFSSEISSEAVAFAGASKAVAYAEVGTPDNYPECLESQPDDAVVSLSPFTYSLLEASFTNPALVGFYNTSFDTSSSYDAIYGEVKESLSAEKSQILAGSLSLLLENIYPKITPLLNAISITNAFGELLGEETIVMAGDKEDYIQPYLSAVSKAVSDGSNEAQALLVNRGLLNFLEDVNALTFSKLNEFISILAGEYRLAIYSTCKPSTFGDIPSP